LGVIIFHKELLLFRLLIAGELAKAVKEQDDLKFGLYYSLFEWFNPLYLRDKANGFQTREFAVNKMTPELKYLVRISTFHF
jgi:alpha-L-fucosidase